MDTSEKYIKMCESTKEIQCDRIMGRYKFGELYYIESGHSHGGKFRYIGSYDGYEKDKKIIEKSIWLPRQDQLQEMVDIISGKYLQWHNGYVVFQHWYIDAETSYFTSMEQLWLAFVMYEKYQKIWDNEKEEWIEK